MDVHGDQSASLLGAFAADGIPGLGFRFTRDPSWSLPNPVGLDGVFEGLCPPYFPDMRARSSASSRSSLAPVGRTIRARPGPFRDNAEVKAKVERYSPELIDALGEVTHYLHDTFGKFPATIPSVYVRMYAQAQHIDLDYYDAFYGPRRLSKHTASISPGGMARGQTGLKRGAVVSDYSGTYQSAQGPITVTPTTNATRYKMTQPNGKTYEIRASDIQSYIDHGYWRPETVEDVLPRAEKEETVRQLPARQIDVTTAPRSPSQ